MSRPAGKRRRSASRLHESREQLHKIARPVPTVELGCENAVPSVAARARRAGQGEDVRAPSHPGQGPRLDRRGPNFLVTQPPKELAESRYFLINNPSHRLWAHVAPGDPRPPGHQNHVDLRVGYEAFEHHDNPLAVIRNEHARPHFMARGTGALDEDGS